MLRITRSFVSFLDLLLLGDEVYTYNEFGYTNAVSDVDFHPHDNIVVFCSFGGGHPVLVYVFDPKSKWNIYMLSGTFF